ncbi:MAG: hypothetical protein JWM19_3877 [Actinomycetia bacterium]|nr:hypothetical protein [Actinomycetes bacterium]
MPDAADPASFLRQLASADRVYDVRRRPGQALPGPPARGPGGRPVPAVALLTRSCDAELDAVQELLGKAGVPTVRVNSDELAGTDLLIDPVNRVARLSGRWVAPTVTWLRHFSPGAIDVGLASEASGMFLRESWHAAAGQLAAISRTPICSRRPGLLAQLRLAERNRVPVPRTVVTTDLAAAGDALRCSRLVIKAAHQHFVEARPGRLTGVFPVIVERDDLPGGPCHGPPVVVQEYVRHDAELRVYYVAGEVHAFEVVKDSPADPWAAPERVRVRPTTPPPSVARAARVLAAAMRLRFGVFDFLVQGAEPVFLEVDPEGDWRWAERESRTSVVTLAAARMLASLHHATRRGLPETDRGSRPLDLLTFLS